MRVHRYPNKPDAGNVRILVLDDGVWIESAETMYAGYFTDAEQAIHFCEVEVGVAWKVEVWTNGVWQEVANGK